MNIVQPNQNELMARLRITNPTGAWNKYNKVTFDRDRKEVIATYGVLLGNPEDGDFDYDFDIYTPEEFVQFCGFDNMEHYRAMRHYIENKPVKFLDLRQGMVVWSEAMRARYIIGAKKDNNSYYVTQLTKGKGNAVKRRLTRDEVDTGFFKKSKKVEVPA